jgi:O-antigen ligase
MNTNKKNKFYPIYLAGIFLILLLHPFFATPWFFPVDWGKNIVFRCILSVLIFIFTFQLLFKKNELNLPDIKKNKILWILGAIFIITLLSAIFSVDPLFSFWGSPYRGGGFINFASYIIFAVFLFLVLKNSDWQKVMDLSIFAGMLVALLAVIQFYALISQTFITVVERPFSTEGNSIMLATYMLLLSFFTLSFLFKKNPLWKKIFYAIALFLFLFTITIAGSKAGYLGLAVGLIYFFMLLPKKMPAIKIGFGAFLILAFSVFILINTNTQFYNFLSQNKITNVVIHRVSFSQVVDKNRVAGWKVGLMAIVKKPILGWGPENFAVGFDKFYDPSIPNLGTEWWDRAHNAFIEIAVSSGIPALIIYLSLFIFLFWQLHKNKHRTEHGDTQIIMHGLQATFIAYLIAIFFSFDNFSTYFMCFLLAAYSTYLIYRENIEEKTQIISQKNTANKNTWWKPVLIFSLFCFLILFLWQYNYVPLKVNAQVNIVNDLVSQKKCDSMISFMDEAVSQHSFIDSYARMQYGDFIRSCNAWSYPANESIYLKKGLEVIEQAVKVQPSYTRYWIYLSETSNNLAFIQKNDASKNELIKQANNYLDEAIKLSPKRQEILISEAKIKMTDKDYKGMKDYSEKCVEANPGLGDCYWYLGLAEICLKDNINAEKNIKIAGEKGADISSLEKLTELSNAFVAVLDYQSLISVYQQLILANPNEAQYHSSLAFVYKQTGDYGKARQEALKALELSPESKPNVDAFLNSLPY